MGRVRVRSRARVRVRVRIGEWVGGRIRVRVTYRPLVSARFVNISKIVAYEKESRYLRVCHFCRLC